MDYSDIFKSFIKCAFFECMCLTELLGDQFYSFSEFEQTYEDLIEKLDGYIIQDKDNGDYDFSILMDNTSKIINHLIKYGNLSSNESLNLILNTLNDSDINVNNIDRIKYIIHIFLKKGGIIFNETMKNLLTNNDPNVTNEAIKIKAKLFSILLKYDKEKYTSYLYKYIPNYEILDINDEYRYGNMFKKELINLLD